MLDKVGETFDGIVSGVTAFGIFVQLTHVYVDGLVHITALDRDYYHFDPVGHRLVGERTGGTYRLGDTLKVVVAAVNLDDRKIDFVLPGSDGSDDRKSRRKGAGRGGRKRGSGKRRRQ
jgi:ribonuclease R